MPSTMCMAHISMLCFMIASAVGHANECSSGGELPSNDVSKSFVSLVQAKVQINTLDDGFQDLNVADKSALSQNKYSKGWFPGEYHPKVHTYTQDLESLERSPSSLLRERDEVVDPSASVVGETLFIVLSDSSHYSQNLKWISDSWGKDVPSSHLLAIGDEANNNSTRMRVEPTHCPAHTPDGTCCKAAEAIITAHRVLEEQPNLKWAYIIEDDAYVRPTLVDKQLQRVDPVGVTSRGTLIAVSGICGDPGIPPFLCGAGGIALSRKALMTLVGDSPSKYRSSHMQTCELCGMARGDETIGAQAYAHNITILKKEPTAMGMYGWTLFKQQFDSSLTSDVEPIMYHPVKSERRFTFLNKLFGKGYKSAEDLQGSYCANYAGNAACTSNSLDMPFMLQLPSQALLGLT